MESEKGDAKEIGEEERDGKAGETGEEGGGSGAENDPTSAAVSAKSERPPSRSAAEPASAGSPPVIEAWAVSSEKAFVAALTPHLPNSTVYAEPLRASCPQCDRMVSPFDLEAHLMDTALHVPLTWIPFWKEVRFISLQTKAFCSARAKQPVLPGALMEEMVSCCEDLARQRAARRLAKVEAVVVSAAETDKVENVVVGEPSPVLPVDSTPSNGAEPAGGPALLGEFPNGELQCPACLSAMKAKALSSHLAAHHEGFVLTAPMQEQLARAAGGDDDVLSNKAAAVGAAACTILPTRIGSLEVKYIDNEKMLCPFGLCGATLRIVNFHQHCARKSKAHPLGSISKAELEEVRLITRIVTRASHRKLSGIRNEPPCPESPEAKLIIPASSESGGTRASDRIESPQKSALPSRSETPLSDIPVHPKLKVNRSYVVCPGCPLPVLVRALSRHLEKYPKCKSIVLAEPELLNGANLYSSIVELGSAYERKYVKEKEVVLARESSTEHVQAVYAEAYRKAHGHFPAVPQRRRVAPPTPERVAPPTPKRVASPTPERAAPPTPKRVAPPTPPLDSANLPEAKRPRKASSIVGSTGSVSLQQDEAADVDGFTAGYSSDARKSEKSQEPPEAAAKPVISDGVACPVPNCGKFVPLLALQDHLWSSDCQPRSSVLTETKSAV